MISPRNWIVLLTTGFSLIACSAVPVSTSTPKAAPPTHTASTLPAFTSTPSPALTFTSTPPAPTLELSPTSFTPTAAPPPVTAFLFKKDKCIVQKLLTPPYYKVQIAFLIQWEDVQGEDGYWLYRDGNRVAELPADTTVYTDYFELVKGGRTSTYYLVTYNGFGQSKSTLFSHANPC